MMAKNEKTAVFRKFELYDLEGDPRQLTDIATREPEVTERLKRELLRINASVLADAPIWGKEAVEREKGSRDAGLNGQSSSGS